MELTGALFAYLTVGAAVAAVVGLALAWPVLARRAWWWVPIRLLALLLVVVLTMLTMGVNLNRKYQWFVSWSDLMGATHAHQVSRTGADAKAAAAHDLGRWAPGTAPVSADRLPAERGRYDELDGGRWTSVQVGGPSGHRGRVAVWVPDSYFTPAGRNRTFPVLMFLHGVPGKPEGTMTGFGLPRQLTEAVRQGRMRESVIVMPEITPRGKDTECVSSPGLPIEEWLSADVPAWVAANLRVQRHRGSWAVGGYSGGGYCAALLGMRHPRVFSGAMVMAGYYRPSFESSYRPYPPEAPELRRYDLVDLVRRQPPPVALWVQTSKADRLSWGPHQDLVTVARAPLAVHAVVQETAGHRLTVWQAILPEALTWLGRTLPGFAPALH